MAQAVVDGAAVGVALGLGNGLADVAAVLAVDLAQGGDDALLPGPFGRAGGQAGVDEIVEAAELAQTVLAAEFVAARHAAFAVAVAQPVEPHCVDLGVAEFSLGNVRFCRNCGAFCKVSWPRRWCGRSRSRPR